MNRPFIHCNNRNTSSNNSAFQYLIDGAKTMSSLMAIVIVLTSCSFYDKKDGPKYGPTLADLAEVPVPIKSDVVPQVSIDEIEENYRTALSVATEPSTRHRILIRLGDLEMTRSEQRQVDSTEQKKHFSDAIAMYEELVDLNAQRQGEDDTPTNERLLYQLSKAYALDGRLEESDKILNDLVTDFPESAYAAEADFRRAELAFSDGDYELSEKLYAQVMAAGDETSFYGNSVYMHGWSQFKRGRHRSSIQSFTEVLDRSLIEGKNFEDLSSSQQSIAKDTLRILSIVFSYLDGPQTIEEVYANLGQRHYEHLLYRNLGDLYLEQERFRDSADTYRYYVKVYPNTDLAPAFSGRAIEVYQQGDFPSLILPAKEEYVTSYGAYSDFWKERSDKKRTQIIPYLKTYLIELSSYYHAEAQALKSSGEEYRKKVATGKRLDPIKDKRPLPAEPNFIKAADLYGQFVFTFPEDPKASQMVFLQGEAYFEASVFALAVQSYETVAYKYKDPEYGANSGYSALLALTELIKANAQYKVDIPVYESEHSIYGKSDSNVLSGTKGNQPDLESGLNGDVSQQLAKKTNSETQSNDLTSDDEALNIGESSNINESGNNDVLSDLDESDIDLSKQGLPYLFKSNWVDHNINSSLVFADNYPLDKRAAPVLTKTAQDLFEKKELFLASKTALRLTKWQPQQSLELQKTAWLILSHSYFDLRQYDNAEYAYRELLARLDQKDKDRSAIIERIAASIYKQAEQQVAGDDRPAAIDRLLSIRDVAPGSEIAISAQYDAANYLIELQDWSRAENVLRDFQTRYPKHPFTANLMPKLALIYQESEQWGKAATSLVAMSNTEKDPQTRRQSLYLAAELYEKSGDDKSAIEQYRRYATDYPQPFGIATEARFHLVELYEKTNNIQQRNIWLQDLIDAHAKAGSQGTDRSKYLAASAAMTFANEDFKFFSEIPLTAPLKKSLAKKKNALDKALKGYKGVLSYSVAEFSTQSNHRIGMIYAQLSQDLMSSQRPKGLDELALEQYEILLEEQAFPFEEKAIDIHTANSRRAWDGIYDDWVKKSFEALAKLLPARFGKKETRLEVSDELY